MATDVLQDVLSSPQLINAIPAVNQVVAIAKDPNTNTSRMAARSLYHSQIGDLLKKDILTNTQTRLLIDKFSRSPQSLALAAQTSPFLSEVLYQVSNDMRRGAYNKQKNAILGSIANLSRGVGAIATKRGAELNNTIKGYGAYKDIAARANDPLTIARFLHDKGVSLSLLPKSVKSNLRKSILSRQEDAGESMYKMRNRWSTTNKNLDLKRLKNNALRSQGRLAQAQAVQNKTLQVLQQLRNTKPVIAKPLDSGKEVDLRPVLASLMGGTSPSKRANLLDMLASQHALKRQALRVNTDNKKRKGGTIPQDQLIRDYLRSVLSGQSSTLTGDTKGVLFDRLDSILKGTE